MKTVFQLSLIFASLIALSVESYCQLNWILKNESGTTANVENNGKFLLVNMTNNSPLKYGKRSAASRAAGCINIVWGGSTEKMSSKNFVNVERQPGKTGPIQTGELVALRFEGGGYLAYEVKKIGVNLAWVSSNTKDVPYIWEIRTVGNKIGEKLKTNSEFGIYCHRNNDWLAYCYRKDPGINLGWTMSCTDCRRDKDDRRNDVKDEVLKEIKIIIEEVKSKLVDAKDLTRWCVRN